MLPSQCTLTSPGLAQIPPITHSLTALSHLLISYSVKEGTVVPSCVTQSCMDLVDIRSVFLEPVAAAKISGRSIFFIEIKTPKKISNFNFILVSF